MGTVTGTSSVFQKNVNGKTSTIEPDYSKGPAVLNTVFFKLLVVLHFNFKYLSHCNFKR